MIEKSLPSPKTLVKAANELKLDDEHFEEVYNKVIEKIDGIEAKQDYEQKIVNEYYLEFVRNA